MADEQTQAVTNATTQADAATMANANAQAQDAEDVNALPSWAQKVIADLRKESASHRKAKADAEKAAQTQADAAAKEQGKWRELYEAAEPKAKRAGELEKFVANMVEAELADVPERVKPVIPAFDDPLKTLDWLRNAKAAGILAKPQTPNTDAASGAGDGSANNAVAARKQELELWSRMGLNNAVRVATGNNKR